MKNASSWAARLCLPTRRLAALFALGVALQGHSLAQGRPPITWMAGGHANGVHSIALSPDSQALATASFDTTAKVFSLPDKLLARTLIGHEVAALSVAYFPDGSKLVTGGYEGTAKVWNPATGALVGTLTGHSGPVNSVAVSPDGARIATGSSDGTVKVWNAADGSLVGTLTGHTGWVYAVAFSPDGASLASGSGDATIRLWRVSDGAPLGTLTGHADYVLSVRFSPSGATLVSTSTDDTVKLWRLSDGAIIGDYTGQTMYVYDAAFSPDGTLIASGAGDCSIVVRRVSDGVVERTLTASGGVQTLAFTADGAAIYAGADDGMVGAWATGDGSFIGWLTPHWGTVTGVAVSPDGTVAASVADDGWAVLHSMSTGATSLRILAHDDLISSVAISPDGALLCTGSHDYTAALWNAADGNHVRTLSGHTDSVLTVAFAADGLSVATGGSDYDSTIRLWQVSDGAQIGTFVGHTGAVRSLAFSSDGQWLASGSADGTVRKWRVSDRTQVWQQAAASSVVLAVAFAPNGQVIASGAQTSASGTLKLWNATDGSPMATSAGWTDPIRAISFSPDSLVLVTGGNHGDQGRLQFWHGSSLALLQTFDEETGTCAGSYGVTGVAFTPDSEGVLFGRTDGTVVLADNPFWPALTSSAVPDIAGQIGEVVVLRATLTVLLTGSPILGKPVQFELDGTGVGAGVTNASGEATCDYRIPESFDLGGHVIGAVFAGDAAYAASNGTGTLTVSKANTAILVDHVVGMLTESVTLRARLIRTTDDSALAGRTLTFKVEATPAGSGVTDQDGCATVEFDIPFSFGGGDKVITVDFAGDEKHEVCTAYGTLTVLRINTTVHADDASGRFDEVVTLRATLTKAVGGAPLENLSVTFKVAGTEVGSGVTDAAGIATYDFTVPDSLIAGEHVILAEFGGTAHYSPSDGAGTLTALRRLTSLAVSNASGTVSRTTALSATLTRAVGAVPIEGRTVAFTVEGTSAGSAATNALGVATVSYLIPDTIGSGDKALSASFAGDSHHEPSSGSATLTVAKANTSLWTVGRTGTISETVILRAYDLKRTTDNTLLVGKTITFTIDGTAVGSASTDSGGDTYLIWTITEGPTTRTIGAVFGGDAAYNGSSATSTLTCEVWAVKMVTFDRTARITDTTELKARLLRSDNTPLYNKPIEFWVDGTFVIERRTDVEGYAKYPYYTVPDGDGAGVRTITSYWRGNGGYGPIAKTAALVVNRAITYIWVLNKNVPQGSLVGLYAYFRRLYDYQPQTGKLVTFLINGTKIADVTTGSGDEAGIARYTYQTVSPPGIYTIRCEFAGDAWLDPGAGEGALTIY